MNVTISGHHMDVTNAIRQHVEDKLVPIQRHGVGWVPACPRRACLLYTSDAADE